MGRRNVPSDLVRNIELLVGVALPLFLTGVWVRDHLTGSGHWTHPLESGFFEWLSLAPLLALVGLLHSLGMAVIAAVWPRAANRGTVVLASVVLVPLLVLGGKPPVVLAHYALPLAVALVVYALASRIPGSRAPRGGSPHRDPEGGGAPRTRGPDRVGQASGSARGTISRPEIRRKRHTSAAATAVRPAASPHQMPNTPQRIPKPSSSASGSPIR